jgi:hypothetical protein
VFDAFQVRLTTLPDDHIGFDIAEGPYARTEAAKILAKPIRAGVFAVSCCQLDAHARAVDVIELKSLYQQGIALPATLLRSDHSLPQGARRPSRRDVSRVP